MEDNIKGGLFIVLICVVLLFLIGIFSAFSIIGAGERGVVISRATGVKDVIFDEGFHLTNPITDKVKKINIQTNKIELLTSSTSKDQQIVSVAVAVNFKLDSNAVNKLYQEIGSDYISTVLNPAIESSIKTGMAQFKAEELITGRERVEIVILEILREKVRDKYMIIDRVNIIDLDFSESFNSAIEAKVIAEQEELKAINDLERIKIEAEQKIIRAEAEAEAKLLQAVAEAESIKLQNEALTESEDILKLRWIEKWNGVLPKVTGNQENLLMVDLEE